MSELTVGKLEEFSKEFVPGEYGQECRDEDLALLPRSSTPCWSATASFGAWFASERSRRLSSNTMSSGFLSGFPTARS
jgi:hypothetical protein